MANLGDEFSSMKEARDTIRRHILDDGESYASASQSDHKRFVLTCKVLDCKFRIRASNTKKNGVKITIKNLHTCIPATHYKCKPAHSMWYLKEHHRASIIENRDITPAQI